MYEVAVDPSVWLGSYVYVQPTRLHDQRLLCRYTGAIKGDHVDIYDWRGRADRTRGHAQVTVTPAPTPARATCWAVR